LFLVGLELAIFEVDLTQTGCEGVLEFSKALSGGDVHPNRVQLLMNPRKGKFSKTKHQLKRMSYSKKKKVENIEKKKKSSLLATGP